MTAEQAFGEMVESLMKRMGNAGTGCRVCIGTVKEVDEKEGTCVVERDDAPKLNEVRLNAVIDEEITDRFMVVPAKGRARHVGSARRVPVGRNFVMLFITGPLYSGKRTFAKKLGGTCCFEVQKQAETTEDLEALAKILSEKYDIITATEVGGGVVPVDATERANREKAGRLACLLAARADCVVQMFCGIPTVLKGELPK